MCPCRGKYSERTQTNLLPIHTWCKLCLLLFTVSFPTPQSPASLIPQAVAFLGVVRGQVTLIPSQISTFVSEWKNFLSVRLVSGGVWTGDSSYFEQTRVLRLANTLYIFLPIVYLFEHQTRTRKSPGLVVVTTSPRFPHEDQQVSSQKRRNSERSLPSWLFVCYLFKWLFHLRTPKRCKSFIFPSSTCQRRSVHFSTCANTCFPFPHHKRQPLWIWLDRHTKSKLALGAVYVCGFFGSKSLWTLWEKEYSKSIRSKFTLVTFSYNVFFELVKLDLLTSTGYSKFSSTAAVWAFRLQLLCSTFRSVKKRNKTPFRGDSQVLAPAVVNTPLRQDPSMVSDPGSPTRGKWQEPWPRFLWMIFAQSEEVITQQPLSMAVIFLSIRDGDGEKSPFVLKREKDWLPLRKRGLMESYFPAGLFNVSLSNWLVLHKTTDMITSNVPQRISSFCNLSADDVTRTVLNCHIRNGFPMPSKNFCQGLLRFCSVGVTYWGRHSFIRHPTSCCYCILISILNHACNYDGCPAVLSNGQVLLASEGCLLVIRKPSCEGHTGSPWESDRESQRQAGDDNIFQGTER